MKGRAIIKYGKLQKGGGLFKPEEGGRARLPYWGCGKQCTAHMVEISLPFAPGCTHEALKKESLPFVNIAMGGSPPTSIRVYMFSAAVWGTSREWLHFSEAAKS